LKRDERQTERESKYLELGERGKIEKKERERRLPERKP